MKQTPHLEHQKNIVLKSGFSVNSTRFEAGNDALTALLYTLPETNMLAPENGWLENDRFLLGWPIFRGYDSFRGYKYVYIYTEQQIYIYIYF